MKYLFLFWFFTVVPWQKRSSQQHLFYIIAFSKLILTNILCWTIMCFSLILSTELCYLRRVKDLLVCVLFLIRAIVRQIQLFIPSQVNIRVINLSLLHNSSTSLLQHGSKKCHKSLLFVPVFSVRKSIRWHADLVDMLSSDQMNLQTKVNFGRKEVQQFTNTELAAGWSWWGMWQGQ